MPETLSAAELEQRVHRLTERLEELRGTTRPTMAVASPYQYAGLDLSELLPELAPVLATLVHQDPDEPLALNARVEAGARRVALAGLITLLKGGQGLADFPARYQELVGAEPDYTGLEKLLPNAMREAGLALPPKQDARRLLEALFATAGLPASMIMSIVEYFAHYWRSFHPQPGPMVPLEALEAAKGEWGGLDAATRTALEGLAKRLLPNAAVAGPAVESLVRVMAFLRTQPRRRVGDLFTHADEIEIGCGVNPKALLQNNEEALAHLAGELGHAWHPEQFLHVLTANPRGTELRFPNGALTFVEKAVGLPYWGTYRIEGKPYLVLPNEGLTVEAVTAMKQGLWVEGNRAVYRGDTQADVFADGWPQVEAPRHFYEEKQSLGWFYFHVPPVGRTLRVGDAELPPRAGIQWGTSLFATVEDGRPRLNVRLAGLRVTLPELAGRTLQLECPEAETAGRLTFELDERGAGGIGEVLLAIAEPKGGTFELFLQDHATGEVIEFEGRPLVHRVPMPEIMLFAEATGQLVPPNPVGYAYGVPSYLIFHTRPVNTGAMQMMDIGVDKLDKTGEYEVNRLRWQDASQPLNIYIDPLFGWAFGGRVETVWTSGEMPEPPAPLAYVAESPVGYTVASPDYLAVDDISLIEHPLVVISRENVVLAAHSWDELNWLANFPAENRRFSGTMLRRALHVAPEFDLAGRYTLSLKVGGQSLGDKVVTVLPKLDVKVTPAGAQLEDTKFKLTATCEYPCFIGGKNTLELELGTPLIDREVMENSPFQPKPLEGMLQLQVPLLDVPVALTPEVVGYRLLDENEGSWIRKSNLGYDELGSITLVLFGANAHTGSLKVGDSEALTEEFYEGFATFSLASVQETLRQHETEVQVEVDGRAVGTLVVTWHPKISSFEAASEYLSENKASLELKVEGPEDVVIRLEATAPDGRVLGEMEARPSGDETQTVIFDLPASRDYPVITIRAYDPTEVTGVASGAVEVRNAAFEPEIEAINKRIAAEPQSAELRYERAQLLLDRGLRKAAARDFQAAVDLGMTELLESTQYQQFMSQRLAESFHEDLKAIASFFVPFARKELNIG